MGIRDFTDMQEYIHNEIIKRIYIWTPLFEAKKLDLTEWCIVRIWNRWYKRVSEYHHITELCYASKKLYISEHYRPDIIEVNDYDIIWLPCSLSRVLEALGKDRNYYWWIWKLYDWWDLYIKRKLLNDDNTDANLFQQTQDTQLQIALYLWRSGEWK